MRDFLYVCNFSTHELRGHTRKVFEQNVNAGTQMFQSRWKSFWTLTVIQKMFFQQIVKMQEPKCSSQGWRASEHWQWGKYGRKKHRHQTIWIKKKSDQNSNFNSKTCLKKIWFTKKLRKKIRNMTKFLISREVTRGSRWLPGRSLVGKKATLRSVSCLWWWHDDDMMMIWWWYDDDMITLILQPYQILLFS